MAVSSYPFPLVDITECTTGACANDATCLDQVNHFVCICAAGFTGVICDENIDDCTPNPCIHGTCVDHVAGFSCSNCEPGYQGNLCEIGSLLIFCVENRIVFTLIALIY